jgi:hypothetical protein
VWWVRIKGNDRSWWNLTPKSPSRHFQTHR